ncbi:MAG: SNF2-related protein [Bryobacteraceae bacterium]|nr:SNF2-related protein [Bryobacteraceae bacterium]MDW8379375.1 SNF2-related protein [Bryobacterales bacterium]
MMEPLFQPGDIVVRRNRHDERGTICGPAQKLAGRHFYRVLFPSNPNPVQVPEGDLEKFNFEKSIQERLLEGEFGSKSTFSRLLTYERLFHPLQDTLYSLRASRTEFQPYQFKPLLKFLRSAKQRLLLADEVGLGKTIEAGLILCELLARHPDSFRRVLVICKASLCTKWQMELRKRFDLRFEIWRAERLGEFLRRSREGEDLELWAICSLESFRSVPLREEWEAMAPTLDLLIIDEAHHLKNAETSAHKACRSAAESAEAVLALTATPIQMGSRDLFNLLSLLDEEEFASYPYFEACMLFNRYIVQAEQKITQTDPNRFQVVYQTLTALGNDRVELFDKGIRARALRLKPFELEQARQAVRETLCRHPLYPETLRLLTEADPASRRATVEIQRNLAELNFLSRIFSRTRRRDVHLGTERVAVVKKVNMTDAERRLYNEVLEFVRQSYLRKGKNTALLFGLMMPQRQLASCIPAMVEFYEDGISLAPGGLDAEMSDLDPEDYPDDLGGEKESRRRDLLELIQIWRRAGQPDSKFSVLEQCLRELQENQPGERIVIFSYFKKTLEYLSRRLTALGYSNTIISGSFTPEERDSKLTHFRDGDYQILLSTEVGSEGLDLQFCHILFNYDLPWNPMVVEQRIGRLDRFGQKAPKILIFNLSAPGTIEDEILSRLYQRIKLFESYIGDLEAILGNEIVALTKDLFDPELSDAQRQERIERVALLLEKRKMQFEEWEKSSPQFIGHDEYYQEEVQRVQALGRFIRPVDIAGLVEDFLSYFDKRSELKEQSPGIYHLKASEKLVKLLMSQPDDPQKGNFCARVGQNTVPLTFDSEIAERELDLTFIHIRHFFIRTIIRTYRQERTYFHRVAQLQLSASDSLQPGLYLYLVARATIRAAREQDLLLPILVNLESMVPLDEDASDICLARMISEGKDVILPYMKKECLERAFHVGESVLVERFQARRDQAERLNQAFVDARLASVRESYRLKIGRRQALLENALKKKQQAVYVRMLEGGIRKLEADLGCREAEIEGLRLVTAEHSLIAAGVLQVSRS